MSSTHFQIWEFEILIILLPSQINSFIHNIFLQSFPLKNYVQILKYFYFQLAYTIYIQYDISTSVYYM